MGRIVSPKTQARTLVAEQRATRVISLLAEGKSQRDVAREVGLTQPRVCQILKATRRQLRHDARDRLSLYRARQLAELEGLKAALFPRALGAMKRRRRWVVVGAPDLAAVDRMLSLMKREAALLGLDAAAQAGPAAVPLPGRSAERNGTDFDLSRLTPDELRQWAAIHGKLQIRTTEEPPSNTVSGSASSETTD